MIRASLHRGVRTMLAAAVAVACAVVVGAPPASAHVTTVDGSATGVQVGISVLGIPTTLAATPNVSLPGTGGGPFTATLASVDVPGILSTGVLDTSTEGGNLDSHAGYSTSSATVAGVQVDALLADLVTADAIGSTCSSNGDGSIGTTVLANAHVNGGATLSFTPDPNTTITIPGIATITLNEQSRIDIPGAISAITVTAIHIQLLGGLASGDISIGKTHCEVIGPDVLMPETPGAVDPPAAPGSPDVPGSTPTTPGTPAAPGTPGDPSAPPAVPTTATPRFTG
jgi:hypothetical protein